MTHFQDTYKLDSYRDIYIFSNVPYAQKDKLKVPSGSICIFLNKAPAIKYYKDSPRILIRRHNRILFGKPVPGVPDIVLFSKSSSKSDYTTVNPVFNKDLIRDLQKKWYADPKCTAKGGFTLGFYIAMYLQNKCHRAKLHLVNFGTNLNSRYHLNKCHDWSWQEQQLKSFDHIYLG